MTVTWFGFPHILHSLGENRLFVEDGENRRLVVLDVELVDERVDLVARVQREPRCKNRERVDLQYGSLLEHRRANRLGHKSRNLMMSADFDQLMLRKNLAAIESPITKKRINLKIR